MRNKVVNNSPQAKRNRNNRKRGSSFEKKVADILEMFAVPYSGTNSRFGWGDVRDHESKDLSTWLGECKNITIKPEDTSITIKREWIDKNNERAEEISAKSFIAFMQAGKPFKYIMIDDGIMTHIVNKMGYSEGTADKIIEYKKKSHNSKNVIVPLDDLHLVNNRINTIKIKMEGDDVWQWIMEISAFSNMINEVKMHAKYKE
jgi:hypothetical protein